MTFPPKHQPNFTALVARIFIWYYKTAEECPKIGLYLVFGLFQYVIKQIFKSTFNECHTEKKGKRWKYKIIFLQISSFFTQFENLI